MGSERIMPISSRCSVCLLHSKVLLIWATSSPCRNYAGAAGEVFRWGEVVLFKSVGYSSSWWEWEEMMWRGLSENKAMLYVAKMNFLLWLLVNEYILNWCCLFHQKGSLMLAGETWGWRLSTSYRSVVPHLVKPATRKYGWHLDGWQMGVIIRFYTQWVIKGFEEH